MSQPKVTRTVTVTNPEGWHLRAASAFAKAAGRFESKIEVVKQCQRADGRSVIQILALGIPEGTEVVLEASGRDADEALEILAELIAANFEEGEQVTDHQQVGEKAHCDGPRPEGDGPQ
jgi:phosphotransferase system HPr (HPr) family protein